MVQSWASRTSGGLAKGIHDSSFANQAEAVSRRDKDLQQSSGTCGACGC